MTRSLKQFFEVLRVSNARNIFGAQVISDFGDWFYFIAIMALIYENFGSVGVGLYMTIRYLPTITLTPFAGVIADRFPKKAVMIFSDVVRGICMIFLGVIAAGVVESTFLTAALLIIAAFTSVLFRPARMALLPQLVSKEIRLSLNALDGTFSTLALTLAPALGGLFLAEFDKSLLFFINAMSFFISALLVYLVRFNEQIKSKASLPDYFNDLKQGTIYLFKHWPILQMTFVYTLSHIGVGATFVFISSLAIERLAVGEEGIGFLMTVLGLGSVLGLVAAGSVKESSSKKVAVLSIGTFGFFILALAHVPYMIPALILLFGMGVLANLAEPPLWTFFQNSTLEEYHGRVFAMIDTISIIGLMIGSSLCGWFLDYYSFSMALSIIGASMILPLIMGILFFMKSKASLSRSEVVELNHD